MRAVLASASPRRRELLSMLGLEFDVCPSAAEEKTQPGLSLEETVMYLAREKGRGLQGNPVISADTIVVIDGKILGKPKSEEEAFTMLRTLSGRTHEVFTGICVNDDCRVERSLVTFAELTDEEIRAYIATGEPMDKAGAYGAQGKGAVFVEKIEGDFFNVMGLPVHRLYEMLKEQGVKLI